MSVGGGCDAAMTARTRCGWVNFWKCGKLHNGKSILLRVKEAVYMSYVSP